MGLFRNYVSQTRKPEGFLGKLMLKGMNHGHARMADWALDQLEQEAPAEIVDLGCGGGRNAAELLRRYPRARVTAIDYSALALEKSFEFNRAACEEGRCLVRRGDVSALDLDAGAYALATAFETIYFWPGLEHCFTEVRRILQAGGRFLIVNESDGQDAVSQKFEKIIEGMNLYTPEQIVDALQRAGFTILKQQHHEKKPWIMILAEK